MKHLGTVQIETDRLILRKFNLSDTQALFNNWANDPEVTKFLVWSPHLHLLKKQKVYYLIGLIIILTVGFISGRLC